MTARTTHVIVSCTLLGWISGCDPTGGIGETGNSSGAMSGGQTSTGGTQGDLTAEGGGEGNEGGTPDLGSSEEGGSGDGNILDVGAADTCDPLVQDCPRGQGCYDTGGSFVCSPVDDMPALTGDPCDTQTQCQQGNACVDAAALNDCAAESCCAEFCDTSNALCSAPQDECQPWPGAGAGFEDVGFCGAPAAIGGICDPLVQDCVQGQACYGDGLGGFACGQSSNDGGDAQVCEDNSECGPGYACTDAGSLPECAGNLCCAQYCDLSDDVCNQPDATCITLEGPAPAPGFEDVGYCGV